jgi:hypothetical protein
MVKKESEDSTATTAKMEPKDSKMSAFERKRLENIAANQAIMKDLSTTAKKIIPKTAAPKPPRSKTPRKREPPVKREATRPTRTSSRIAGLEADGEGAKRKFEEEFQFAQDDAKAKKMRVAGDLNLSDIAVEGKKWTNDDNFLSSIMRGAQPYERTFDDSDIKTTTDQELKSLREKMSGLELYKTWEPNGENGPLCFYIGLVLTAIQILKSHLSAYTLWVFIPPMTSRLYSREIRLETLAYSMHPRKERWMMMAIKLKGQ